MVIPQASEGISGIKFHGIQHQKYTKVFIYYPPTVNSLDWKIDRQKWLDGIYATHLQSQVSTAIVATQYELPAGTSSSAPKKFDHVQPHLDETWVPEYDSQTNPWWDDFPPQIDDEGAEYTYIINLDKDIFTINSTLHLKLDRIPRRWTSFILECTESGDLYWSSSLDPAYTASIDAPVPTLDADLIAVYEQCTPAIHDQLYPQNTCERLKTEILLRYQRDLERYLPVNLNSQWTPDDVPMQKLVYAFIKYSCWEAIEFKSLDFAYDIPAARNLLRDVDFPQSPVYYIPIGRIKVLVSLAMNLDRDEILKMEVGKVINLTKDQNTATACIVSLIHAVIVKVDRTKGIKVTHTPALELFGTSKAGRIALITTLSPHPSHLDVERFPSEILPNEIFEIIFRHLAFASDGMQNIASFARTCNLFSAIAHDRTVRLPGRTFLTYPSGNANLVYAIDDDGWRGLYHFLGCFYQGGLSECHRNRCWVGKIDGADFGLGRLFI